MSKMADDLPIGVLVDRTGVNAPTLRAWEDRFDFPKPARGPGGHRRYAEADVARVQRVLDLRAAGHTLEHAIAVATDSAAAPTSLFGALRTADPTTSDQRLTRAGMLALSRAIEEECAAHAASGVLIAAFQTPEAFAAARGRWHDLSRTIDTYVIAAFDEDRQVTPTLREVALDEGSPLQREWAVICDAPGQAACLVGWEALGEGPARGFEAGWSVDPLVVAAVADAALALVGIAPPRRTTPAGDRPDQRAVRIANRALALRR